MINIIYNRDLLAMPSRLIAPVAITVEPFEMYGTPYGMFIPVSGTGNQFVRWIQKGMKDKLPKKSVFCFMVHISNDGELMLATVDTEGDIIVMTRVVSKEFSVLTGMRDTASGYSDLVRGCKTISEAVRVLDEADPAGLFEPIIFMVDDWVKYAKEKGYTETFYWTDMGDIREQFGQ